MKSYQLPKHRWVSGNLPLDSVCVECEESAGDGPGLRDLRCVWCQRTVHSECAKDVPERCDYGKHRQLIVPPERVVAKQGRTVSSPRRRIISDVLASEEELGSRPLVVVGNNKSGNSDSAGQVEGGGGAQATPSDPPAGLDRLHEQLPQYWSGRPRHSQLSQGPRVSLLPDLLADYKQADLLQLRHQRCAGEAVSEPEQVTLA